ncbi:MAG TPA: hypothetical protein VNS58_22255 [Puia sp.]|jgi:hypothetical protein|nr:hypothetical protein [Puia sp.]
MKKIIGVIAIMLSVALFFLYRQLTHGPTRAGQPKEYVPAVMQENLMLSAMLFQ